MAEYIAEGSPVQFLVVGNDDLGKWLLTAEDDVTSLLTLELKSFFQKCGNALTS